jgi:isocitrate dehydrogenase
VVIETIEEGYMTGDLAAICEPCAKKVLDATEFLDTLAKKLADGYSE